MPWNKGTRKSAHNRRNRDGSDSKEADKSSEKQEGKATQGASGMEEEKQDDHHYKQKKPSYHGRGRGALVNREKKQVMPFRSRRGKHPDCTNQGQLQRPRPPGPLNGNLRFSTLQKKRFSASEGIPAKSAALDPKTLKEKSSEEVVYTLNQQIPQLKLFLQSQEEQHSRDESVYDLIFTLANACEAPPGEDMNTILAALKGSVFLSSKIPSLLERVQTSTALDDKLSQQRLIEYLITVFMKYLTHLPSSYADLPYAQLKEALDQSTIDKKEELQIKLEEFKQARDDIIRGERQRRGQRYMAGEKPPNDFRKIPICPKTNEITSQERPFLRKNIIKGRYENAEHYLDVQFRLLREDFLEPLREGIHEIVQNVPRKKRQQWMKKYRNVTICGKEFTQLGIIHQVQIDVSGLDTSCWARSKRLLFGSFLCLSKDNFKTMLFATVSDRNREKIKTGWVDIHFIENQDVWGIENGKYVYQMVESPAYFEAYRYVLKGLKELDETTLPFRKYLVECCENVDPPEYLRRDNSKGQTRYDLRKALNVKKVSNAAAVPVFQPEAWPSVKDTTLNSSQLEALRAAITKEFCVIQGPPGTGKTYVGAKIVRCLLDNRHVWDPDGTSPVLMVCYTNHALDQFLEKVLDFLPRTEIIRVGGGCKSETLRACKLNHFKYRHRDEQRAEVKQKMFDIEIDMLMWKERLARADRQPLEFVDLEELLHPAHAQQLYNALFPPNVTNESRTPENTFKLWLCDNKMVGSWNQTPNKSVCEEPGAKEEYEEFYDASLFTVQQHANDVTPSKSTAVGVWEKENETKTHLEPEVVTLNDSTLARTFTSEQSSSPVCNLAPSNVSRPIAELECTPLRRSDLTQVAICVQGTDFPQASRKLSGVEFDDTSDTNEDTIAVEMEADLIQNQRWIEGDEDLLQPISKTIVNFKRKEIMQEGLNEETDNGWIPETNKKNEKSLPWMETSESKAIQVEGIGNESEPHSKKKSQKKKNKEKKKKETNNSEITITGDISFLAHELKKHEMMSTEEVMGVDNIWNLPQIDRLRLFLFWIEAYRERYRVEIHQGEQEYQQICEHLQEITFEEEEQIIRKATVVGMTTTGAARYHSMLQKISPKIVVIEEAAEVLEAHIVTSLSRDTKHTILIGDHKQLRPKATVYQLAQKYNLEISLFERMVTNSMECKRLSVQHRMRPEIAALTKRIYDHQITDHESVGEFPNVSGICHNLFFIDHCQPEKPVETLHSYSNRHEADFLVALCRYLLLQGYDRKRITILTMYTGQLLLIQDKMPKREFDGVKVCAVDDFQGEENDIILLSLVRSNKEGCIGFLSESNRICVALSRARQGFYCIGNFNLLKSQSKLWKEICDDLRTKHAIGDSLNLVCKKHTNVTTVTMASDFLSSKLGGCAMPCGSRLDCGHACNKPCHALDKYHEESPCLRICFSSCPNNHKCTEQCHYPRDCHKCRELVLKTLPRCSHEQLVLCSIDPDKVLCQFKCEKILKCGHPCLERCTETCQCSTVIETKLACGHSKHVLCRERDRQMTCKEKCSRPLECGHTCPGLCHEDCRLKQCNIKVFKDLPCGHRESVPCFQDPQTVVCYALCPRVRDCGHRCSSFCGLPCQDVECKELCEKKCNRGHLCQKRCHFLSSCDDCLEEVNTTYPTCGHSITIPCSVDPTTLKCKKPCEKVRVCGHPCEEICSTNCEIQPCKVPVSRTLPCGHVVTLLCHKTPEKVICKKKVEINLLCGHKMSLECHAEKAGVEHILCKKKVQKELRCKHRITLQCFKTPDDCICKKKVHVELPCRHTKSVQCSTVTAGLQNVRCLVKVTRKLACNHEVTLPCHEEPKKYDCQEKVAITLSCGHSKVVTCLNVRDKKQDELCHAKVIKKLPCGHEKEMKCSDKPDQELCDAPCERVFACEHPCPNKCGDDCASFKCFAGVEKPLKCGYHNMTCLCSEDVSQIICSNPCTRTLICGHQCPGKCSEECSQYENQCQQRVVKNLNCAGKHSLEMYCKDDPNSALCQERCIRNLDCGHPCPGLCSQPCESMECRLRVEKQYPCGHKKRVECLQSKTATCKEPCKLRKRCKHKCRGVCGEPCSKYSCDVLIDKTLPCGHMIKMSCGLSVDDVQCPVLCKARLPCGHQCSETCSTCVKRASHGMCELPCNRLLVCSHRCQATCGEPCPPCDRKCFRRCPHGRCVKSCLEPCGPCREPCTWVCVHYKCKNLCGEECDRPRCDAPCPKELPCQHPCTGLCGENCPTLCATCNAKKFSSVVGPGGHKSTRILQLFDCGHIVKVEEMDAWMLREQGNHVRLIQCPRCSIPITFSYRYGNIIKRTVKNLGNVKVQIRGLADETAKVASGFLENLNPFDLQRMRFPRGILNAVRWKPSHGHVPVRNVSVLYTLRNHLLVMKQIKIEERNLQHIEELGACSKELIEMKQYLAAIRDALGEIVEYLQTPELDLRTLQQVHEHVRKFALFASILEAQSEAIKHQRHLSSSDEECLKMAREAFNLFVQGNRDALQINWLDSIVASMRQEAGLSLPLPNESTDFENFPGFDIGVWKLCEHRLVNFTSSFIRNGEKVIETRSGCRQCVVQESSDKKNKGEPDTVT